LLNDCFDVIVEPVVRARGVVDKYVGDGLLAFFEGPGHADRALRAGREMLAALDAFNLRRDADDRLAIGVAIHAGETLVGTVGAPGRRDYTVIGDVVNVAARLEDWNKTLGSSLVVSDAAFERLSDGASLADLAGPTTIELRGREAHVRVRHLPRD